MTRKFFRSILVTTFAVLLTAAGALAAAPANKAPVITGFDVPDSSASPFPC